MKIQVLTLLEYSDKKYDHLPKIRVIGIRSLAKENEIKVTLRIGKKKWGFWI